MKTQMTVVRNAAGIAFVNVLMASIVVKNATGAQKKSDMLPSRYNQKLAGSRQAVHDERFVVWRGRKA